MNRSPLIALSVLMMIHIGTAEAELKKLREWPSSIPSPNPEIKRQYEYDPEAGAVTKNLISTSRIVTAGQDTLMNSQVYYRNGYPKSWSKDGTQSGVSAYHGFIWISSMKDSSTSKIKYTSSGNWPAKSIKGMTETIGKDGDTLKSGIDCLQIGVSAATTIFQGLPGNIYRYNCVSHFGSISPSGTLIYNPPPQRDVWLYSDYLDMLVTIYNNNAPQLVNGQPQIDINSITLLDSAGIERTITYEYNKLKAQLK